MISTQLNITFISYFVKKINCISVFHRFFSKSVYVMEAYVCVLHSELQCFDVGPFGSCRSQHSQTHTLARHLISYLKHLVLCLLFWFVNKFMLSHLAYDFCFLF